MNEVIPFVSSWKLGFCTVLSCLFGGRMGLLGYGEVWGICLDSSALAIERDNGEGCDGVRGSAGFPPQS